MNPIQNLDAKTLYEFIKSTASTGTNFGDGVRGGEFPLFSFENFGQGVNLGNLRTYTIMPETKATFSTIVLSSSTYIPIPKNAQINGEFCFLLDCPRTVSVSGDVSYSSVIISGFDSLNQKVTCSGNPTPTTFQSIRAFKAITSIFVTPTGSTSTTITASTDDGFELPFNDYGYQTNLINAVGDADLFLDGVKWGAYMIYNASTTSPVLDATYTPAAWPAIYGPNSGTPRPIIIFNSSNIFYPSGNKAITFLMSAYSFPTIPKYYDPVTSPLVNPEYLKDNFNNAFGAPNYSEGWVGYKG